MTKLQLQDNKTILEEKINTITRINVENIPCYCGIGIDEEERKLGQKLLIDVYVDVDSSSLSKTDNIKDTLSYVDIHKLVQDVAKSKPHFLIEYLAHDLANNILKNPLVHSVKIKVRKPHIPYPEFQGDVSVEIERRK
ncbi:MAG: dihydroneopterin aldolase [Candidatus Melainabacteria bacterium]|nr:dihydroneopterin aldolase [Candidatus Melainabacteria bacterium]